MLAVLELIVPVIFVLFGLCIGSFLNVVIYRLPNGKSIVTPRSSCPKCGHMISAAENIPVLSFLILGGKCKVCKRPISPRYPIIEALNAGLWLLPLALGLSTINAIIAALFSSALLAIFMIDFDTFIIPDQLIIALIVLSLPLFFTDKSIPWNERLIGFAVGGGILYALGFLCEFFLKKEGMGGGDIKLLAACGLVLGWKNVLLSLFAGAVASIFVIAFYQIFRRALPTRKDLPLGGGEEDGEPLEGDKDDDRVIPFAPALAIGVIACYYWGGAFIGWYMGQFATQGTSPEQLLNIPR